MKCKYCDSDNVWKVTPQYPPKAIKADYYECKDCGLGKWTKPKHPEEELPL